MRADPPLAAPTLYHNPTNSGETVYAIEGEGLFVGSSYGWFAPAPYVVSYTGNPTPTLSIVDGPNDMTIDTATGEISWIPTATDVGPTTVVVGAANSVGSTEFTFSFTTHPAGRDMIPPKSMWTAPTTTDVTHEGATLTWTAIEDNYGVAGYKIKAQKDGRGNSLVTIGDTGGPVTTYTVTGLQPESGYRIWVAAYDAAGNEAGISGATPAHFATTTAPVVAPITKFFVVDYLAKDTFAYDADGGLVDNYNLVRQNRKPVGATSNADGSLVWTVDRRHGVFVYDDAGNLRGSWTIGGGLKRPEGIATDGTSLWIVDRKLDEVFFFADGASQPSGTVISDSSFVLVQGNRNPKGITTDGTHLWVVNDGRNVDKVFKYTTSGTPLGSWTIDSANTRPTGITIDATDGSSIWIVDSGADEVFRYDAAVDITSGSQPASARFGLAPGNVNPQGIADPPPVSDGGVNRDMISQIFGELGQSAGTDGSGLPFDRRQAGHSNPMDPLDVNDDGLISPLDVLLLIGDLNGNGARQLPASPEAVDQALPHLDVNGDKVISAVDVLGVIGALTSADRYNGRLTDLAATITGTSGVLGLAHYEVDRQGLQVIERFTVDIAGAVPGISLEVRVDGVLVGQIDADQSGTGSLILSSQPGDAGESPLPETFPDVAVASRVAIGDVASGTLVFDSPGNATGGGQTQLPTADRVKAALLGDAVAYGEAESVTIQDAGVTKHEFQVMLEHGRPGTHAVRINDTVVANITVDSFGKGRLKMSSHPVSGELSLPAGFPAIEPGDLVTVDGVSVGQVTIDDRGDGELRFSSNPQDNERPFPVDFPTVNDGSLITVGDILSAGFGFV